MGARRRPFTISQALSIITQRFVENLLVGQLSTQHPYFLRELFDAPRRGFVARVEPRAVGRGIIALGGGRQRVEDSINPTVGFVITAKPGDWVEQGEPLATIFARNPAGIETGRAALREAIVIAEEAEPPLPLVSHRVTMEGVAPYEP